MKILIKTFQFDLSETPDNMDAKINDWIENNKPSIESIQSYASALHYMYIIFYVID